MELKYIVYITINLCNATGDYPLHRAVRKYGYENFKRTTIKIFDDTEEGGEKQLLIQKVFQ